MRASMEMTLRWAERSKKYFEEHKNEVPWAKNRVAPHASSGGLADAAGDCEHGPSYAGEGARATHLAAELRRLGGRGRLSPSV